MKKTVLTIFACAISLVAAPKLYTVGSSGGDSELSATIYSKNESAVSSKISGYVKKIYVEEGENVKKGAPLFEIDAASTQAAALSANANYLGAKAAADDAKRDFGRYKNLFEKGVVSEKEFERAKLNYEIKTQMMASSQAMLSQAKNEQGYSLVRAPIDGVVLKKYMTVASMAMPGQPVLLLSGKGDLRLKADIYEQELQNFKVGQTINFKVGSKIEEAKVISIASSGGTARNFTLRAEPKKQDGLYSGMFVKLVASAGISQISVPINTLTKRGGIVGVFELANGVTKFRAVKIKRQSGDFAMVDGISVGAKIIENPKENLQDGQKAE